MIKRNTKQKKTSEFPPIVMFLVICGALGSAIGFLSDTYLKDFMNYYGKSTNIFVELLKFYAVLGILIGVFLIHIVIHEAGHLIFGLMTGYSFVSFRIGSFTLIKEDNKLRHKKFNIPGTAGQCLMKPPDLKDGKFPFIIYNFGGIIMNLIVAIAGILIVILVQGLIFPLDSLLFIVAAVGIFTVLTNGIPMKIGGIANDAYNVLSMIKDEEARLGFHLQLRVNGLQSIGARLKDMPLEMFKLKENTDLCNPINTSVRLVEYNWHLDNMDLEGAKECIDSFIPYLDKLVPLFRNEINCERMFLELIGNCDRNFIDDLYDKKLRKYIKIAKFMIGKKRLLMAYEGFYNEDKNKALKYYEDTKQLAKKYPVKGEADMELMIIEWIKEKLNI